jgi:toxin YoeB
MKKLWEETAWEDYLYWQKNNPKILIRINDLIKVCERTPFSGIGKPEPLKKNLKGYWSRRIDKEHRLVYKIQDTTLIIIQCRFHY